MLVQCRPSFKDHDFIVIWEKEKSFGEIITKQKRFYTFADADGFMRRMMCNDNIRVKMIKC